MPILVIYLSFFFFQQRSLLPLFPWQEMCVARRRASSPSSVAMAETNHSIPSVTLATASVALVTVSASLSLPKSCCCYSNNPFLLVFGHKFITLSFPRASAHTHNHLKFSFFHHGCHGNISASPHPLPHQPLFLTGQFIDRICERDWME